MVRRATVFRVRRLWQKELTPLLTKGIPLEVSDPSAFDDLYFKLVISEALRIIDGIHRDLFIALIQPDADEITMRFCFELFKWHPEKYIQNAEFAYLASYFATTRKRIQTMFYELKAQLLPVIEGVHLCES